MKIKATLLFILLAVFLLNVTGRIGAYSHSHQYTAINPVADAIKSDNNNGLQSPVCSKLLSNIIQDYYQSDEDDDPVNSIGVYKPQKASSFSATLFHNKCFNSTLTSLSGEYTPKRYILFRVFII
ncbi:MAG: hypothetical protein U0T77_09695 [Chitinophagales bacterium]